MATKKPKAKAKKVTHGVDLSVLSYEQLELLRAESADLINKIEEEKDELSITNLKKSGKFQEWQEKMKAIHGEITKNVPKTAKFTINVPIELTVKTTVRKPEEWYTDCEKSEVFDHEVTGTVAKDSGLAKRQVAVLRDSVEMYVQDACDQIFELFPDEFNKQFDEFVKQINALGKEVRSAQLDFCDLA